MGGYGGLTDERKKQRVLAAANVSYRMLWQCTVGIQYSHNTLSVSYALIAPQPPLTSNLSKYSAKLAASTTVRCS